MNNKLSPFQSFISGCRWQSDMRFAQILSSLLTQTSHPANPLRPEKKNLKIGNGVTDFWVLFLAKKINSLEDPHLYNRGERSNKPSPAEKGDRLRWMRRAVLLYTCGSDEEYNFFLGFRALRNLKCPPHPSIMTIASNRIRLRPRLTPSPLGKAM